MGFYGGMIRGFTQILPQGKVGDAPERAAVFFSVAWVGHLMLADVGLFGGQVTRSALGGGALTVVLFIFVGLLYAAHVAYVRRRVGIDETPEIHADSGIGSVIGGILGLLFVLIGWASVLGAAVLAPQ